MNRPQGINEQMGGSLLWTLSAWDSWYPVDTLPVDTLPVMDELDAEPIIEELGETIDPFSSGKAPPSYGIPPKVM